MADLTYVIKTGTVNGTTEFNTVNAAATYFKAGDRMGAGVGTVPAASTLFLRVQGFVDFGGSSQNLGGIVLADNATSRVCVRADTNPWNASSAVAVGPTVAYDGLLFNASANLDLSPGQAGLIVEDLVIKGGVSAYGLIHFVGHSAARAQVRRNMFIMDTPPVNAQMIYSPGNADVYDNVGIVLNATNEVRGFYAGSFDDPSTWDHNTLVFIGGTPGSSTAFSLHTGHTIRNNYAGGWGVGYATSTVAAANGNASSLTDAVGTGALQSVALSTTNFGNVTLGSVDLRVKIGSVLKTTGATRLGTRLTDAFGASRADPATIGALEPVAAAPVLSSPTNGTPGATSLDISASTDTLGSGNMYFLRRSGGSAASAATILGTGESQVTTGSNPQTRNMTGFTAGSANNYVDIAQTGPSNVVTVGPFTMAAAAPDPVITGPTGAAGAASITHTVNENSNAAGTWTATNAGAWSLTGTDAAALSISGGVVTKASGNFNFETKASYSFNVVSGSASQAVTLNITNLKELSSPTVANVGTTTATLGFSSDILTGTAYFLRRTGLTPASSATIISTGESQAMSGSNPQTRNMTAFTAGLTYYVDMASSGSTDVVSAGPFYPGTGRPTADINLASYTPSSGSDLFAMIDEDSPGSDADYITSPVLTGSFTGGPIFALNQSYPAGTYTAVKARKWVTGGSAGEFRINFLDGSNVVVGQTAIQAMNGTPTTYTLSVTLTGTATRWQIEERA